MGPRADRNVLLFCFGVALLVCAALVFSRTGDDSPTSSPPAPAAAIDPAPLTGPPRPTLSPQLRRRTRRFLDAFLRYEVGGHSPPLRRALRDTVGREFSAQLLARPPRRLPGVPTSAHIVRMRLTPLSSRPARALLSGCARRGAELEQFSFLFESIRGRWLVVGPGE